METRWWSVEEHSTIKSVHVFQIYLFFIVCIQPTPSQKTPPPLFRQAPPPPLLNLQTIQPPYFLATPSPLYIGSLWNWIFQWTPIKINFSCLSPSHPLKLTKFLVKISQLVKTGKTFFYKLFLSLNQILLIFLSQNCNHACKSHHLFPSNPRLKLRTC